MFKQTFSLALLGLLVCADALPALATDYLVTVGSDVAVTGDVVTLQQGDRIAVDTHVNHSYNCVGIPSAANTAFAFSPNFGRSIGNLAPRITDSSTAGRTRVAFTASSSTRYFITVASTRAGGEPVRLRCEDTTLFGGFNTSAHDVNVLELQNSSSSTIRAAISLINTNGRRIGGVRLRDIRGGGRLDLPLEDLARDTTGTVRISHNGPAGQVIGRVVLYDQSGEDSLSRVGDVKLEPVSR